MSESVLAAERTLIGGLLVEPSVLDAVAEIVRPEHCLDPIHRRILAAAYVLRERSERVDVVTLRQEWDGDFPAAYLGECMDAGLAARSSSNAEAHARIIREAARRRGLVALMGKAQGWAQDSEADTDAVVDRVMQGLTRLHDAGAERDYVVTMSEAIKGATRRLEAFCKSTAGITGIPTGLPTLDRVLGGLQAGSLYSIGARPSRGKSALAKQLAVVAAVAGYRVLFFTLEMLPAQVAQRMILGEAGVDRWELRADGDRTWPLVGKAIGKLRDLPIEFDRHESPTLAHIRTHVKRAKREGGCDLVICDYFQRCSIGKAERLDGLSEVAMGLKSMAQALDVAVVLPAQLRRDAQERRPMLSDFKECGALEHESDVAVFLHPKPSPGLTPDQVMEQEMPAIELIVAKHREGETRTIPMVFERRWVRFIESEPEVKEWRTEDYKP